MNKILLIILIIFIYIRIKKAKKNKNVFLTDLTIFALVLIIIKILFLNSKKESFFDPLWEQMKAERIEEQKYDKYSDILDYLYPDTAV